MACGDSASVAAQTTSSAPVTLGTATPQIVEALASATALPATVITQQQNVAPTASPVPAVAGMTEATATPRPAPAAQPTATSTPVPEPATPDTVDTTESPSEQPASATPEPVSTPLPGELQAVATPVPPSPTPTPSTELKLRELWTQTYPPGQIHFAFLLHDEDNHTVTATAEEVREGTRVFEQGFGTGGWEEVDYKETNVFVHADTEFETVFVLDLSNSMTQTLLADGTEYANVMMGTLLEALAALPAEHRVGVVEFHDRDPEPAVIAPLTTDRAAVKKSVAGFVLSRFDSGSSRLWDSVETAASMFTPFEKNPNVVKAIVLFTDGRDAGSALTRLGAAGIATDNDIQLYAVQIGSTPSEELSAMVMTTGGADYRLSRTEYLAPQLELLVDDLGGQ